jgi:copper chaperone CopZ
MFNKLIFGFVLFFQFNTNAFAQFTFAEIGVDGLTCSQCQRSVEMGIRKLDFVDDVKVNLENTDGKIIFKPGKKISFDKIAKAVTDAGFSVRFIKVNFIFNNLSVSDNFCFLYEENNYQFIKSGNVILNGEKTIKILGKNFMSPSEYKNMKSDLKKVCDKSTPSYFVML